MNYDVAKALNFEKIIFVFVIESLLLTNFVHLEVVCTFSCLKNAV